MHTFEVKRLNEGWYFRCEARGIAAHDPWEPWTQEDAIKHAAARAKTSPPAEIVVFDEDGLAVMSVFRVGVSGLMPAVI